MAGALVEASHAAVLAEAAKDAFLFHKSAAGKKTAARF